LDPERDEFEFMIEKLLIRSKFFENLLIKFTIPKKLSSNVEIIRTRQLQ